MWNKDELDGKVDRAKGKVKQAVGGLIHDDALKAEGRRDETVGNVEKTMGHARRTVDAVVEKVKRAVKR